MIEPYLEYAAYSWSRNMGFESPMPLTKFNRAPKEASRTKFSVRMRLPIIALARATASGDMPPSTSGSVSTTRSRSFWLVIGSFSASRVATR